MKVRILNILLALSVLFSSAGLVFNKHYCQSELKNVALFVKAENCHQKAARKNTIPVCPKHNRHADKATASEKEQNGCCDDETTFLKNAQDQQLNNYTVDLPSLPTVIMPAPVFFKTDLLSLDRTVVYYLNYKPPLLFENIPIELQSFLC